MNIVSLSEHTKIIDSKLHVEHREHCLPNGASLILTNGRSKEQVALKKNFKPNERQTAMHFLFNGQTSFTQDNQVPPAFFGGDKCNLMIVQPHQTEQTMVFKGDFAMATFYIELDQFVSLLHSAVEALPENFQRAIYQNRCSCNNFRWSPQAYYVVQQLLNTNTDLTASQFFLESKMLELLTILLETEHCDYYSSISISSADKKKIHYVQELLLSDLSMSYTLRQLARQAATNEFILKKGFREIYGKPIYQYLTQKRMEKAMQLLSLTPLGINEIAALVGYNDASAFTRTFRRVFALLPSQVRKNTSK